MSRDKAYNITMLDSSQLRVVLPKKSNGQDCLDQVSKFNGMSLGRKVTIIMMVAGL